MTPDQPLSPHAVAERYIACVRARDLDGWVALFDENAVYILPNGNAYEGVAAIREVQQMVFAASPPSPTAKSMLAEGNRIAVEIEVRLPDGGTRRTVNHYTLNDAGRITRLSVYMQGG